MSSSRRILALRPRAAIPVDVVVVGGGVMGAAAARQLARRGREVVLPERFGAGHTRGASHLRARGDALVETGAVDLAGAR